MQDSFDPYREWLGIAGSGERPDHYALLGLKLFESDLAVIAAAAERQIAAVFKVQAGPPATAGKLAVWQRLMNELGQAKHTLSDPREKARYDQTLRRELALAKRKSTAAAATGGRNLLPPGMESQAREKRPVDGTRSAAAKPSGDRSKQTPATVSAKSVSPQPKGPLLPARTAQGTAMAAGPMKPVAQPGVTGSPTPPQSPGGAPQQPWLPQYGQPGAHGPQVPIPMSVPGTVPGYGMPGNPIAPQGAVPMQPAVYPASSPAYAAPAYGGVPYGAPGHAAPVYGYPQGAVMPGMQTTSDEAAVAAAIPARPARISYEVAARSQKSRNQIVAVALVAMLLLGAAIGFAQASGKLRLDLLAQYFGGAPVEEPEPAPPTDEPEQEPAVVEASEESADNEQEMSAEAEPRPAKLARRKGKRNGRAKERIERQEATAKAVPDTTPVTVKPKQKPRPATLSPEQQERAKKFYATLIDARTSLGERAFDKAQEQFEQAKGLAVTDEHREQLGGMEKVAELVKEFWGHVGEGTKSLEDAGELQVGNTLVAIVDVTETQLVIRAAGENKRYPLDRLPAGLALAIAKRWYDERPENQLYLGAFYFVDPNDKLAEAKQVWDAAKQAGIGEAERLLALLTVVER